VLLDKLKALSELYRSKLQNIEIKLDNETVERLELVKMAIRNIFKERTIE